MIDGKRVLAIIPARKGSKGIPGKNMKMCAGRPLIGWTIEDAKQSEYIDHIIVSTNDECVIEYADSEWGVRSYLRPDILSRDDSPTEGAVWHTLLRWEEGHPELPLDYIVLLQATSPVREGFEIDGALIEMSRGYDSLVSVVEHHGFLFRYEGQELRCINYPDLSRPMRQDMEQYHGNGSFWIFTRDHFLRTGNRLGGRMAHRVMPPESAIQIDTPLDLEMVEYLLRKQNPAYDSKFEPVEVWA